MEVQLQNMKSLTSSPQSAGFLSRSTSTDSESDQEVAISEWVCGALGESRGIARDTSWIGLAGWVSQAICFARVKAQHSEAETRCRRWPPDWGSV